MPSTSLVRAEAGAFEGFSASDYLVAYGDADVLRVRVYEGEVRELGLESMERSINLALEPNNNNAALHASNAFKNPTMALVRRYDRSTHSAPPEGHRQPAEPTRRPWLPPPDMMRSMMTDW